MSAFHGTRNPGDVANALLRQIVGTYEDAATSGASLLRLGMQRLQFDARDSRFDLVLSEALDAAINV